MSGRSSYIRNTLKADFMKHIITTGALLLLVLGATARNNAERKPAAIKAAANIFQHTKLEMTGENIRFKNLPKKDMELYIMDEQGIVEQSGTINRGSNKVDIKTLPAGNHIIALKQGIKIKVFGFMAEVVIKG